MTTTKTFEKDILYLGLKSKHYQHAILYINKYASVILMVVRLIISKQIYLYIINGSLVHDFFLHDQEPLSSLRY